MKYTAIIALPLLLSVVCSLQVQAESDSSLFGTEAERLVTRGLRHYNNQDYDAAFRCFRQAAETGDAYAQYNLGLCYFKGEGVEKNPREAKIWYRAAAEQGYEPAKEALRNLENEKELSQADDLVSKGKTFLDNQEYHDAVECFRLAAQMRNAHAMYYLGLCYEKGLGVDKNPLAAQTYYGDALALGYKDAEKAWERAFRKNEKKYRQMLQYARQGDSRFYIHVGRMYRDGYGVERDAEKARYWLRKAADRGDRDAQRELQEMGDE